MSLLSELMRMVDKTQVPDRPRPIPDAGLRAELEATEATIAQAERNLERLNLPEDRMDFYREEIAYLRKRLNRLRG